MVSFKNKLRVILWRVGWCRTLPAEFVNSIRIVECDEALVDLKQDKSFFMSEKLSSRQEVRLREEAYNRLKEAQRLLPDGYCFKIYSAFRPIEEQQQIWDRKCFEIKQRYPDISEEQLICRVKAVCADPRTGFGGHQTGGAVDLTLCDKQGNDYDMGTRYSENNSLTPTAAKGVSSEQRKHRLVLLNCMEAAGFKNYPNEWWHYSFGDRMWGAYARKKECLYGLVSLREQADGD